MLEVTTPAVEESIGADFADLYTGSEQYRQVMACYTAGKKISNAPFFSHNYFIRITKPFSVLVSGK